jgi:hypothetical protein
LPDIGVSTLSGISCPEDGFCMTSGIFGRFSTGMS